jgi:hypothetical protein
MVNARQSKIDDVTIEMHNLIVGQNDVDLLSFDLDEERPARRGPRGGLRPRLRQGTWAAYLDYAKSTVQGARSGARARQGLAKPLAGAAS